MLMCVIWGRYACKAQADEAQNEEQNGKLGPGLTVGSGGVHSGTRHQDRPVMLDTSLYFCACGEERVRNSNLRPKYFEAE